MKLITKTNLDSEHTITVNSKIPAELNFPDDLDHRKIWHINKEPFKFVNTYGLCRLAFIPLRTEAKHSSEQDAQLVFGDTYQVIEVTKEGWAKVRRTFDQTQGWIDLRIHADQIIEKDYFALLNAKTNQNFVTSHTMELEDSNGQVLEISLGSTLPEVDASKNTLSMANKTFRLLHGSYSLGPLNKTTYNLLGLLARIKSIPYLWGGQTVMGADCSGFTQNVFRIFGIDLLRNTSQQVKQGNGIIRNQERTGDLAFYGKADGGIGHVGIILKNPDNEKTYLRHLSLEHRSDELDNHHNYGPHVVEKSIRRLADFI